MSAPAPLTGQKVAKVNLNHLPILAKNRIEHSSLPSNYLAAKVALKECDRIDQIKDISDKHSAIAHYAKQIKDDSLRYYAERIYLRAMHRIGVLLQSFPTKKERTAILKPLGMNEADHDRAYNIGFLPEADLSELVDKTPPASRHEVRSAGWYVSPHGIKTQERWAERQQWNKEQYEARSAFERAEELFYEMECSPCTEAPEQCRNRTDCNALPDAIRWARMLDLDEAEKIRPRVLRMIEWLDDFERGLRSPAKEKSS